MEMNHEQFNVPFDRLIRDDKANVRKKHDRDSVESLKASILAHGVIQPLAVRPPAAEDADLGGQLYRVFAGGRRFRAMQELIEEKKIAASFSVPVIVRTLDDVQATEISLAENVIRRAMEPADEFRAFKALIDQGLTVSDVALRFGQSDKFVRGRLALGNLHPEILKAFEDDEIGFGTAAAYTNNPDIEVQVKHFRKGGWEQTNEHAVKKAMRGESIRPQHALAQFIGEERYREAGGIVLEDLFGEDTAWTSTDIITDLKASRVAEERETALLDGWAFFETTEEFGSKLWDIRSLAREPVELTPEESARMEEIAEELEDVNQHHLDGDELEEYEKLSAEYDAIEAKTSVFTPAQKAMSGIVLDLDRMEFKYGAIRQGDKAPSSSGASGAASDDGEPDEKPKKDPLALTQPLKDQIGVTATEALRAQVTAKPELALALIAAMLEQSVNTTIGIARPSRIKVQRIDYEKKGEQKDRSIKAAFSHYEKMKPDDLVAAVADLFAGTVDLTERWFFSDNASEDRRDTARSEFLAAFSAKPVEHFEPEPYFTSCTKPMIDAAMKEMTGLLCGAAKKSDMAKEAAEMATATRWLPKPLRLKGYKLKKA